jgi:hypothetical protein
LLNLAMLFFGYNILMCNRGMYRKCIKYEDIESSCSLDYPPHDPLS